MRIKVLSILFAVPVMLSGCASSETADDTQVPAMEAAASPGPDQTNTDDTHGWGANVGNVSKH